MGDFWIRKKNSIVYHIFFFRIQSKRNVNMAELLTPERLALLVSVAALATVSIASVLTILLCTRSSSLDLYIPFYMTVVLTFYLSLKIFIFRSSWKKNETEEYTIEVTHMWKILAIIGLTYSCHTFVLCASSANNQALFNLQICPPISLYLCKVYFVLFLLSPNWTWMVQ